MEMLLPLCNLAILMLSICPVTSKVTYVTPAEQNKVSVHGNIKDKSQDFPAVKDTKNQTPKKQVFDYEKNNDKGLVAKPAKPSLNRPTPSVWRQQSTEYSMNVTSMNPGLKLTNSQNENKTDKNIAQNKSETDKNVTVSKLYHVRDRNNTSYFESAFNKIKINLQREGVAHDSITEKHNFAEITRGSATWRTENNTISHNVSSAQEILNKNSSKPSNSTFLITSAPETTNKLKASIKFSKSKGTTIALTTASAKNASNSSLEQSRVNVTGLLQTHRNQRVDLTGSMRTDEYSTSADDDRIQQHAVSSDVNDNSTHFSQNQTLSSVENMKHHLSTAPSKSTNGITVNNSLSREEIEKIRINETTALNNLTDGSNEKDINDQKITKPDNDFTPECLTCGKIGAAEEKVKEMRVQMFKDTLTKKLRKEMSKVMQSDKKTAYQVPKLPPAILERAMRDNVQEVEEEFYAQDQEIIIAGTDMDRNCTKTVDIMGCYSFNLTGKIQKEITKAELWFYKMKNRNDLHGQTFKVFELAENESGNVVPSALIARENSFTTEGWINMNATRGLTTLLKTDVSGQIKKLAIACTTCGGMSYKAVFGAKENYKPLLIIKYAVNNHKTIRNKRSAECDPRHGCCKRNLIVNFHEAGMIEVVEPRNLSIGYCYGDCNEIHHGVYNHTLMRQRLRLNTYTDQPTMRQQLKPCCAPLVLRDAFLMIMESGSLVKRVVVPKVVVESCGCV